MIWAIPILIHMFTALKGSQFCVFFCTLQESAAPKQVFLKEVVKPGAITISVVAKDLVK